MPAETAVNTPVEEPIVATPVLPLVQVPPPEVLDKVDVDPIHNKVVPFII